MARGGSQGTRREGVGSPWIGRSLSYSLIRLVKEAGKKEGRKEHERKVRGRKEGQGRILRK